MRRQIGRGMYKCWTDWTRDVSVLNRLDEGLSVDRQIGPVMCKCGDNGPGMYQC